MPFGQKYIKRALDVTICGLGLLFLTPVIAVSAIVVFLEDPEQYILKSGKIFRKYSIDELTQLIDILRGKMSLVGPRPALWNQDDLETERDQHFRQRTDRWKKKSQLTIC